MTFSTEFMYQILWRPRVASVVFMLVACIVLPSAAHAQTITTGSLAGTVTDQAGALLSEVSITATASEGGGVRTAVTGYDGTYRLSLLSPGTYSLIVERLGYRPKQIEGVRVRAGQTLRVDAFVAAAPPPVEAPEVVVFEGDPGASRPGLSQWIPVFGFDRLPWENREASELGGHVSTSTETLETEGLPAWLSTVRIDGVQYRAARHPGFERTGQREIALPVTLLQSAELVTGEADAEWFNFNGGTLAATTRSGSSQFTLDTFGSWSGGGLHTSKFIDGAALSNNSMWGGFFVGGPIIPDTAHFALGLEMRKLDTPLASAWQQGQTLGGFDQYTRPFVLQSNVISGFGRFDWQLANENALSVRFGFGHITPAKGDADIAAAVLPETVGSGSDVFMSASLDSKLGLNMTHEVRVGFLKSTRDWVVEDAVNGELLPSTRISDGGLRFGIDPRLPGFFQQTDVNVDQSLQVTGVSHRLKVGLTAGITWHDDDYAFASGGDFVFGDASEFAQRRGVYTQTAITGAPNVKFNTTRVGGFIQDTWTAAPNLEITAGVRYDVLGYPFNDITRNAAWFTATGIANDTIGSASRVFSPRFSLAWGSADGRTALTASVGRYAGELEGNVLSELLLGDGDVGVRRAIGNLGGWPTPTANSLSTVRQTLVIPSMDFRAPQTSRAVFGFSQRLGGTTLQFSGTYRSTDFLARRTDLNLFTSPTAQDQNGRPVFGSLTQMGALVAGQPNRRFTDFDLVSALIADGWSRYWGITGAAEHNASASVSFFANYTFSRTEDNWFNVRRGRGPEAQLSPFANDESDAWREGRSDFDLPHRLSAGFELRPRTALEPRFTALYRYRSGYPFTPGFRDGVDVNGDGSGSNDVAFVDDAIAGTSQLLASWDCLRDQVGRFAERNACRQAGVHSLNARVGLTLLRSVRTAAEVFVEGINLIESTQAEPDRALYLVDSSRNLVVNGGTITIPLVVNPHFGEPLVRFGTGRMLRIGLQVKH